MAKLTYTDTKDVTWGSIQDTVNEGGASAFTPGMVVTDTLKDGCEMPFVLVAVNHYQDDELIFVNKHIFDRWCMNKRDTNRGGWNASEMRRHANEDILALLPDELAAVISPRTIVEVQDDGTKVESVDMLWGLSPMEVDGDWFWANDNGEDKQFPYFIDRANRIMADGTGAVTYWWERSADISYSYHFYYVSTSGGPYNSGGASSRCGVCLGFTIRKSNYGRVYKQEV